MKTDSNLYRMDRYDNMQCFILMHVNMCHYVYSITVVRVLIAAFCTFTSLP